jgi:hypothetical protein
MRKLLFVAILTLAASTRASAQTPTTPNIYYDPKTGQWVQREAQLGTAPGLNPLTGQWDLNAPTLQYNPLTGWGPANQSTIWYDPRTGQWQEVQ